MTQPLSPTRFEAAEGADAPSAWQPRGPLPRPGEDRPSDLPEELTAWGDPRDEEAPAAAPVTPYGPRRDHVAGSLTVLERLLAYEEIRQLAARYALAVDARDFDALTELFVDDVEGARGRFGRDVLRETVDRRMRAEPVSFLHVGGHVINLIDANHAAGTVHCRAEIGGDDHWVTQSIIYEDRYERRRGVWYFVRRDHHLLYGADAGPSPLAQPDANWPKRQVGRGTVPEIWTSWLQHRAAQ